MTLGEKIYKLRREKNYTQEQLADLLKVTRQAISRWESDITLPETDKLKELSKIFDCSIDYLLDESISINNDKENKKENNFTLSSLINFSFEYTSKKMIKNIPLIHIYIGHKKTAKGIIAIGFRSIGIISIGLLSLGLLSFGVLSLGLLALGSFSLGLLSLGAFSLGFISIGAIAIGILSIGAISIGQFAIGALSIGNYFALGDNAQAMVAIGASSAKGSVYQFTTNIKNNYDGYDINLIKSILDEKVPSLLKWVKDIALYIIGK